MKKITVRLDELVHTFLAHLAAEQQVSLSQLINETLTRFVVAEKGFAMMDARAARAPGSDSMTQQREPLCFLLLYLRERCFRLGEPEGHVHGAV